MDTNLNELLRYIKKFECLALESTELFISNFGISEPPLIAANSSKSIAKSGTLELDDKTIKYQFHGNGCKFVYDDDSIIDFNYNPTTWEYDGFSVYALRDFIDSLGINGWTKSKLESGLSILEKKNKVKRPDKNLSRYRLAII